MDRDVAEQRGGDMDNNRIKIPTMKVNILSLIKFARIFLKWRRQQIINNHKDVLEKKTETGASGVR